MIRYGLTCDAGHAFDGWFRSSDDFDAQASRGLLGCPACGSASVRKSLMAPAVRTVSAVAPVEIATTPAEPASEAPAEATQPLAAFDGKDAKIREMLRDLRRELTRNSEDVGSRFPEVARQMHAQEIEQRSIHGRATPEEAAALAEEGVEIHQLPPFPDEMN